MRYRLLMSHDIAKDSRKEQKEENVTNVNPHECRRFVERQNR